ncbi:MAG TPA: hypothetical protein VGE74_10735, partial [Gemmata sp.]
GLFGLLLYRLWTMLLTSLMGVLLAGHAGILLVEQTWHCNANDWVVHNVAPLNGLVVGLVVLGILLQAVSTRDLDAGEVKEAPSEEVEAEPPSPAPSAPKSAPWWKKLLSPGKASNA